MRLDSVLDSVYVVGSLWGTGPQVCSSNPSPPSAALEVTRASARNAPAAVTAFVDVNVVPMDTERVLQNHTVLVEDGWITALGPVGKVKVPAGAVRVDGRGKYLMPGLADMHFGPGHWLLPPPAGEEQVFADRLFIQYLAHGVTTLRSLTGSDPNSVQQLRRIAAEFPVPRMYLALKRIPHGGLPLSAPDSVAAYIAAIKAAGYSHIDADPDITKKNGVKADSLTLTALRQGGLPLATHSHWIPFAQALKLGTGGGSVEHLYVFWDSLLGMPGPTSLTPDEIKWRQPVDLPMGKVPALVAAVQRAGVWITPSLDCMERVHTHIKGDGLARIVKALQDVGVKMLLGSDGSMLGGAHRELVALVRAGLTPYQALLTGTRNVAEYFHLLDSAGTVAVGKRADLVLLHGNPLQDVRRTWEPAGVMLAGRWLDRAALDQRQLAAPRFWFEELLRLHIPESSQVPKQLLRDIYSSSLSTPRSQEQWDELERRGKRIFALADSLDRTNRQAYGRVLRSITAELGPIRAILAPEQREAFDINLRVWLREQARQGYSVVIPGVSPTP
jgi:imidazolonepropionase-like amidohydrolase